MLLGQTLDPRFNPALSDRQGGGVQLRHQGQDHLSDQANVQNSVPDLLESVEPENCFYIKDTRIQIRFFC